MEAEQETEEERRKRLSLEAECVNIGKLLGAGMPPGTGFVFMLFDFGAKGNFAYLSNGRRGDIVDLLREAVVKIGGQ